MKKDDTASIINVKKVDALVPLSLIAYYYKSQIM